MPHEADAALLVDDVGDAGGAEVEAAPDVVQPRDGTVEVGAEREGEGVDLAEAPQGIEAVGADAEDDCVPLGDGFVRIPEATRFDDSAPGEGLGEEVQDDVPAPTMVR